MKMQELLRKKKKKKKHLQSFFIAKNLQTYVVRI